MLRFDIYKDILGNRIFLNTERYKIQNKQNGKNMDKLTL